MRCVMMGTGPFAVPTLQALLDSPHEVLALITRPVPPPTGRKRSQAVPNPMRDLGESAGLEIRTPECINDPTAIHQLRADRADLFVVCDYGQILSNDALSAARLGGINLHASLLPKYRGAAPINWAIYHGETETGITVIHMTPRLDAGPNLLQVATPIEPGEDAAQLEKRLAAIGADAVLRAMDRLETWDGASQLGEVQDHRLATKAPRLKKSDGLIDWQRTAEQIACQIRAFQPWPGSYTVWPRKKGPLRLSIAQAHAAPTVTSNAEPGCVTSNADGQLVIACGEGVLVVEVLQPAGKNALSSTDFLRGYPLRPGDRLGEAR